MQRPFSANANLARPTRSRFTRSRLTLSRVTCLGHTLGRFSATRLAGALLATALLVAACSSDPRSASGGGAGHDASAAGAGNVSGAAGSGGLAGGGSGGRSALCGNGQVDLGETCDESAGTNATDAGTAERGRCISLAACPAPSACMRAVLTGSAATCDSACAEAPIACAHGDGCCAPGCAPNEDNDCAVWSCDPGAALGGAAYASMEALSKDALAGALRSFVSGHTSLGYDSARDFMFSTLDVHEGNLECIYTGRLVPPDGTRSPNGFNTEHSWPQSDGASSAPANSDLHHLFPSDGVANGARANFPFGETLCEAAACEYFNGGSELGKDPRGQDVFQVRELRQGDIARAHFYFSIRYNLPIDAAEEATLRQWHCADPPDDLERARNDGIESVQKNRNPFVDRPDFAQRLLDF